MAKCFFTGVELAVKDARLLDISAAHRALRDLRERVASLERLIEQLSHYDSVEIYDVQKHKLVKANFRRMVSTPVSQALSAAYPEAALFLSWEEWRRRKKAVMKKHPGIAPKKKSFEKACESEAGAQEENLSCDTAEAYHATNTE